MRGSLLYRLWIMSFVIWLAIAVESTVALAGQANQIRVMVLQEDLPFWRESVRLAQSTYSELRDYQVVFDTPPSIPEAFFARFGANDAPDIVAIDSFEIPAWADAGYLYDITSLVQQWDGWAAYPRALRDMMTVGGRVYGLLKQTDVRILFLRKDLFPYPLGVQWQPTSWEEILDMARQLKGRGVQYPVALQSGRNWDEGTTMQAFLPLLYGAGGVLYDWQSRKWVVSSQAYLDALEFYETLYRERLANPDVPTIASPWNVALGDFRAGRTAIYIDGQWAWGAFRPGGDFAVPDAERVVGFARIPGKNGGFVTFSGGHAFALANRGRGLGPRNAAVAFRLLSVHLSPQRMARYSLEKEWVAPRQDVVRVPEYASNAFLRWAVEQVLPYTHYRPALPEYPRVSEEIRLMVERVATLSMAPQQALREYARAVARIVGPQNVRDELNLLR